ncbi:enoyl-CoA hydratase [Paraburkholderia sp. BL6669N2]|uniref:enoyl-CoA hydratase n=1 Tax=Paraburkholderia sp. BL6669N2 TaxID=1938807 RepID=UPI000E26FC8C|nr:enoyl-CoA hydratase [Paraburkholderia sp. BL6669N2]REG50962.1 enoyl-CoA hydratase [Paraburkholderia sp. BL6669N2]
MSEVQRSFDQGILTIVLDRPARKNALTGDMYVELASFIDEAERDERVRALLIRGTEQAFTAGNDLEDFLVNPPNADDAPVWKFLQTLSSLTKPVVAAVCGPAIGIGTTLLLQADIVVAGTNAKFGLPFVNLGVCPEAASSLLLPRMIGYHRACELLLLGERIDAELAERYGIVNFVVSPSEVFSRAESIARRLAGQPVAALRATRKLLRGADADEVRTRIIAEARIFRELLASADAQAAIAGFVAK